MGEQRKIRVAVVFGGRSAEHAVSCASAGLVLGAIDRDRYEVVPIGIARDGRWVLTSGDPARLALGSGELPSVEAIATPGVSVTPRTGPGAGSLVITGPSEVPADLGEVDVVLPLLHGTYGEDGTIQGLLEMTGIRYAGAGVLASAAGMDKEYMKLLFTARGLPVGPYVVVRDRDWGPAAPAAERKRVLDEIAELGWPVFVKPARGGSSIGTTRVLSPADLEAAVEDARRYDRKVLVEAAIDGAEVECAVLEGVDGEAPEASVPGQVVVDSHSPFYDFEAKYLGAETRMEIPAPIPAAAAERIRQLACAAFDAISCEGLARVDFFYTPAGEILVNEINTMPGMTPSSGFPMMWAASGLPLPALIDRIIQTALAKQNGSRLSRAVVPPPHDVPHCLGKLVTSAETPLPRAWLRGDYGANRRPHGGAGHERRRRETRPPCRRTLMVCAPPAAANFFLAVLAAGFADALTGAGFSPLTRALKSAPARNFGTEDAATWMGAPVAGFRAVRAGRSLFSKTPNPVIATLSPLATATWMVSRTAFNASVACFLSPRRPESASIRSRLFIIHSCVPPREAAQAVCLHDDL
jgi:D-alanine-D-alanine ligase